MIDRKVLVVLGFKHTQTTDKEDNVFDDYTFESGYMKIEVTDLM